MAATAENRQLARIVADVFDAKFVVNRYWDEAEKSHVEILACDGQPQTGLVSYSTLGLSDSPLFDDGQELDLRLELVGAGPADVEGFANVLATAAFCIINSKWFCCPGRIFPDIVAMHGISSTLEHVLFVPPFLWESNFETVDLETKKVAWLQVVPISESELRFASSEGSEKLEERFEKAKIDVFDLNRKSVA